MAARASRMVKALCFMIFLPSCSEAPPCARGMCTLRDCANISSLTPPINLILRLITKKKYETLRI